MLRLIIQSVIGIICSILSVIYVKKYIELKKVDSNVRNNKLIAMELFVWSLVTISVLIVINTIFSWVERYNIFITSCLDYKDTQLMIISVLSTVIIAFMQLKIQEKLDKQNKIEEDIKANRLEIEKIASHKRHLAELCSSKLKELNGISKARGFCINYNLKQFNGSKEFCNIFSGFGGNLKSYIELHGHDDVLIFSEYFDVKSSRIVVSIRNEHGVIQEVKHELTKEHLRLYFEDSCDENLLNKFFLLPQKLDVLALNVHLLNIKIEMDIEDRSIKYEDKYLELGVCIIFDVIPCSGYNQFGKFDIEPQNVKLEIHSVKGYGNDEYKID